MALFLTKRLALGLLTLWAVSVLVFTGTELLPGDVATAVLGQGATPETVEALRDQMGLDRPAAERYFTWIGNMIQGDMGQSVATGRSIVSLMEDRVYNTFLLAGVTALVAVPLALLLGILSVIYPEGMLDRSISMSSLILISLPEYFTGAALILGFAVTWHVFPAIVYSSQFTSFWQTMRALTLPVTTLTIAILAHMVRMTRAAILDVLRSAYVEMALLKGVPKGRIILRHALPNALSPVINVVAINLGYLVSGVVLVEAIFSFPGLGRLLTDSVANRDIPLVQAVAMVFCVVYVLLNLIADILVMVTNPRLRAKK
jgi:peptide/nickel transport system permease protein